MRQIPQTLCWETKLRIFRSWKERTLDDGVRQFVHFDEDAEREFMMLPTDLALTSYPSFRPWVDRYAKDKDRFFTNFSKVFAKLIGLGIERDDSGKITNTGNVKGGYHSASKKSEKPGKEAVDAPYREADKLTKENRQFRARL